ncbi:MAG: hypothetical protein A2857_00550 [Candidatus Levybacteria bacterium RIFCSPHIGHO2_01_FULL_36_15]|nr:MAG: hypothetical protein A2857_00550 [Candidatus Levybacteria bacterium RIFCSPHIGHO2_01_FULL_36_15]OGH38861.1 MAG: hypothetical protein A2905_05480 [Candidatus Levybacteria bacterium RIFCSPLOWO2_01_FULL_36_10]
MAKTKKQLENGFAVNRLLIEYLKNLHEMQAVTKKPPMKIDDSTVTLYSGKTKVFEINLFDVIVAEKSFENRINLVDFDSDRKKYNVDKFSCFLSNISNNFVRLNHLGISFNCEDLDNEVEHIKSSVLRNSLKLFEEESNDFTQRWLFIGNVSNWKNSLFEIVLNKRNKDINFWIPHFQIDVDTTLTIEQIRKITNKVFGPGFIKWELDVPDYGVVLAMGILENINGTKIALGIGTNLRNTKFHREELLKLVI